MIGKAEALKSLRPDAKWVLRGDVVEWFDSEQAEPTSEELAAEVVRLRAEYDAAQYQRQRLAEYPPIGDQLDALFHAGVFPAEMAAMIQAVKDKYPKAQ